MLYFLQKFQRNNVRKVLHEFFHDNLSLLKFMYLRICQILEMQVLHIQIIQLLFNENNADNDSLLCL